MALYSIARNIGGGGSSSGDGGGGISNSVVGLVVSIVAFVELKDYTQGRN